jgi:hypothetical protein
MREEWGLLRSWWCKGIDDHDDDDNDDDDDDDDDGMYIMMLTNFEVGL